MHPLTTDLAQQILALVKIEAYSLLGAIQDGKTVLGGSAGSGGGTGDPPAGFVGQLTQSNVAFDTAGSTRACSAGSVGSSSLVDNLDAIRLGIEICDDAIGDRHIDWGTGAGQVSAVDVPFQSSSGSISATDVREAIEEAWLHGGDIDDDSVGDNHIDWGHGAGQVDAEDVPVSSGSLSSTNVHDALEELYAESAGSAADHGTLTGLTPDDDHPQYLLAVGTRNVTGLLTLEAGAAATTFAFMVKNTSGGAVVANDVGYIDEAGEFKTTTTQYDDVNWCVVVEGGADNADIYVARRGRVTVVLDANCSIGDYLYTSGTAKQATPQSYMRPEMFAVALTANVAGAGGTCMALLYCHTKYVAISATAYLFRVAATGDSGFRGQIDDPSPLGANFEYAFATATLENSINVSSVNQLAKLRLYNETTTDYRLIDGANVVTNVITLTVAAPVAWDSTQWVTIRSQTCVIAGPPYFVDLDFSSSDNNVVPVMARAVAMEGHYKDTGGAGETVILHPWEAYDEMKGITISSPVANQSIYRSAAVPLNQQRFCAAWSGSGAATGDFFLRLAGYWEAAP